MSVCVLGSINLDIVCTVAELPAPGETVSALGFQRLPGGKGANQAVASARWGATTALIGAVGRDEAADELLAHLKDAGVDAAGIARLADQPTGQAYICVSAAGENLIVVIGGANRSVCADDIAALDLAGRTVFLAQLETPVAAIAALFVAAGGAGKIRILNAAPAIAEGRGLFPLADMIVVNEGELARYASLAAPPASAAAIASAARGLMSRQEQTIVVTLGEAGALAVTGEDIIEVAGRPARVVDTTGAGDCFCGVLAAALGEGADLPAALASANAAAAVSTERLGAVVGNDLRAVTEAMGPNHETLPSSRPET